MLITKQKMSLDFDMNTDISSHVVSKVEIVKYMGVVLDNKLSWSSHIAQVKKNKYPKPVELFQSFDITFPLIP